MAPSSERSSSAEIADAKREVERFCGDCHQTPLASSFPRDRWLHEVDRGFQFYLLSGRSDLSIPPKGKVIRYYQAQAPERLDLQKAPPAESKPRFRLQAQNWKIPDQEYPAIAHILPLKGSDRRLATCDMRSGKIDWLNIHDKVVRTVTGASLRNPDHICATDLDQDGVNDFLVADLGSFLPEDHDRGRVVWLKPTQHSSDFEEIVLLDGIGRVADVESADIDNDGRLDLFVAVFGWQSTGEVILLRNRGQKNGVPQFDRERLDARHGAIHVCVTDLNHDDLADLVVLFSQEHEAIVGFINRGDGEFERETIYRAADPSYGSSGIQTVDLDQDGDVDVLYTNGDTFDSFYVKPYHSIRWIENRGADGWDDHLLLQMPGVHRALAEDLDGDGDLDIAACALIPETAFERQPEAKELASLVWLENQALTFVPYTIESSNPVHATLAMTDVNGDGSLDLVAGNFQSPHGQERLPPVSVWLNQSKSVAEDAKAR